MDTDGENALRRVHCQMEENQILKHRRIPQNVAEGMGPANLVTLNPHKYFFRRLSTGWDFCFFCKSLACSNDSDGTMFKVLACQKEADTT